MGGGTPSQVQVGGYPISGLGKEGGTPSQVQVGGYPIPGLAGYPIPGWGDTSSKVWGVPHLKGGTPSQFGGYPGLPPPTRSGLDRAA